MMFGARMKGPVSIPAIERVTCTTSGFSIHDNGGKFLAWQEHFDDALKAMKDIYAAECVARVEDGRLLATKHRLVHRNFWAPLWSGNGGVL